MTRRATDPAANGVGKAGVVQGALTASGERIAADAVVVALGCWTPFLLRTAGLDAPIYPVKGVSMTAPRAPWPGAPRTALLDEARKPVQRWLLRDAWPVRYSSSRLDGRGNEVVIETLELAYEGFELE